jgi:hypothetical protein
MRAVDLLAAFVSASTAMATADYGRDAIAERRHVELLRGRPPATAAGLAVVQPWRLRDGRRLLLELSMRGDSPVEAVWEWSVSSDSDTAAEQILWTERAALSDHDGNVGGIVLAKTEAALAEGRRMLEDGLPPELS